MTRSIDVTSLDGGLLITLFRSHPDRWLGADDMGRLQAQIAAADRPVLIRFRDHAGQVPQTALPDLPDEPAGAAGLAALCTALASCPQPVVALLDGALGGAAADLALACRLRVARPEASLAFTAARTGHISGAGSTLRLPALIGAEQALALLADAADCAAPEALAMGLIDRIIDPAAERSVFPEVEGGEIAGEPAYDLPMAALRALPDLLAARREAPGMANGRSYLQAVAALRKTSAEGSLSRALADCVEAALLLPPAQALTFEAAMAAERAQHPHSAALTHLLRAERLVAQTPEPLLRVSEPPVAQPALAGASPVMAGLVWAALAQGLPVTVQEATRERLVALLNAIAQRQEAAVQAGTLSPEQRDADWARLRPLADGAVPEGADLVIVAPDAPVPALRPGVPMLVMGKADLPEGAFRLVLSGRVAELGLPATCPARPAARALAFLRRLGLVVVLTGVQSPLGISGRLAGAGTAALRSLLALGVPGAAITAALAGFGLRPPVLPVLPVIDQPPAERPMPAEEIVHRWLAALANEGARLMSAGLAMRASDIDLVAVQGLGFPARSGGPMHLADARGLLIIRRDLQSWAAEGAIWKPVAALDALVSLGRGFAGVSSG